MLVLANIWGWIWAHRQVAVIVAIVVILFVAAVFVRSCYTDYQIDKTDNELNGLESNTANSHIDVWVREQNKKDAEIEVNRAKRKVEEAREGVNQARNNSASVSVEEANRNRCLAYPERCK